MTDAKTSDAKTIDEAALAEAVGACHEVGFSLLAGVFAPREVEAFQTEADRLIAVDNLFGDATRGMVRTNGPRLDRIDPVIDVSPVFARLAADDRILRIAGTLLDGESQLLKDKLIAKPPGVRGYAIHQDLAYWQELELDPHRVVNIALCLDKCTAENGAVEFAPGFHHELLTPPGVVADPDEAMFPEFVTATAEPGDLLLFTALAPHRSGCNRSDSERRILFLTYACDRRPGLYELYQTTRGSF